MPNRSGRDTAAIRLIQSAIKNRDIALRTGTAPSDDDVVVTEVNVAPVLEGDSIRVEVEIVDKRETKKPDRGIVTYRHRVLNQRDEVVLEAKVQRMIRRRAA